MLASVIITNFNYERFIAAAIDSALQQDYHDVEVIVVDDGSTDNSRSIIESYKEQITCVVKSNGGQASAYNAGYTRATGEVVLFLDADDTMFHNALSACIASVGKTVAKVQYPLRIIDQQGNPAWGRNPHYVSRHRIREAVEQRGSYASPPSSGNVYARWYLEQVMPMPEQPWRIGADTYLITLAPLYGEVASLSGCHGGYRRHGTLNKVSNSVTYRTQYRIAKQQVELADAALRTDRARPEHGKARSMKLASPYFLRALVDARGSLVQSTIGVAAFAHCLVRSAFGAICIPFHTRLKYLGLACLLAAQAVVGGRPLSKAVARCSTGPLLDGRNPKPTSGSLSGQHIAIASHTYCSRVFVIGSQQIARACAKQGANVVYISTPISWGHLVSADNEVRERVRIWKQGGRLVTPGLFEIVPFAWVPWSVAKWLSRFSGVNVYLRSCVNLRENVRNAAPHGVDVLINDEPRLCELDNLLSAKASIYRATDLYAQMRKDSSLSHLEKMCVQRADKVIATSQAIAEHLNRLLSGLTVHVVPNGVNVDLFSSRAPLPNDIKAEDARWLLYVGALDERLDWEAVRVAASIAPLYLIGAGKPSYQALARKLLGDRYLGPKKHNDVPAYIYNCAAGFIPLRQDGVNDARSPMKLYEYFASGVPVIGTATRALESESQMGLYLFRDTPQLVAQILDVLNTSEPIKYAHQLRASANRRDWTLITSEVLRQ